jgi:hypothetical protein
MTKSKYTRTPPPPQQNSNSSNQTNNSSGFLGNMFQGMALGTGSSIGHQMVDGVLNGKKEEKVYDNKKEEKVYDNKKEEINDCKNEPDIHFIKFNNCMKETDNNYIMCESILNSYFECLKNR